MNLGSGRTVSNSPGDDAPATTTFRLPLAPRLLTLLAVLLCGGAAVTVGLVAILALVARQWALGALILAVAWLLASLTAYAGRDLRGKWGLPVVLGVDALGLDLPAGRSLIHRAAGVHARVPYPDIEAIETRLEAYRTLGMAMLQRAYVLRRRSGEAVYLFEDRALETAYRTAFFPRLVEAVAARAGVPIRDLGMVEGGGGVLAAWGTHPADWAAPALPLGRQRRIRRDVAITGTLSFVLVLLALLLRLLVG